MELEKFSLFRSADKTGLKDIAACFRPLKSYQTGETLMMPEEEDGDVFFLAKGRIRLSLLSADGHPVSYRDILAGDFFGWLSALDGKPRLTAATVMEKAAISAMTASDFKRMLLSHPSIFETFMQRMGGVVRAYTERIRELSVMPARLRIVHELSRRFGNGKGPIEIGSHEDFATWTGTARETVTRTLNIMEDEGYLRKDKDRYLLLKPLNPDETWLYQ